MSDEIYKATAQLWGLVYGKRLKDDEPSRPTHQIARAMQHGAKSRREYVRKTIGRDGSSRRRLMASGLGSCGVRVVPMDYVDPAPCKDDSGRHGGLSIDPKETPEVQTFQRAWLELNRFFPKQAKILALEYQHPDLLTQAAKAKEAGVSVAQYKVELSRADFWIRSAFALNQVLAVSQQKWGLTG